ncbi:MAG TPA: hypothetical protein VFP33_09360 [Gallionella sp.]|nr:hypothetical protein [Gallionella sp.]
MVITSATSPSIFPPGILAISGTQPVDLFINTPATTGISGVDAVAVDISALGQLLSAASILESGILQSTTTSQSGFTSLFAATQLFVDALNGFLQSGSDNSLSPSGVSLGNLFAQALSAQSTGNGVSILTSLSGVGINYLPPLTLSDTGQVTIDFQSLQSAFNAAPTETATLITQAAQSIGLLAVQISSTFVQLENLTQLNTSLSSTFTGVTGGELAATTAGATVPLEAALTAQRTALELLATIGTPTEPAPAVTSTAELPITTTLSVETTPVAAITTPVATAQPTATAQLPAPVSPNATTAIAPLAAPATSVETTLPTAAAQLPSAGPLTTTESPAAQAAIELPATTTPMIAITPLAVTTALATAPPQETILPVATGAPNTPVSITTELPTAATLSATTPVSATTTPVTTTPTTVSPNTPLTLLVNPVVNASDPAIAAAIMAYHLVDGIIGTGAARYTRPLPAIDRYNGALRVESIHPTKLDLYV